MSQRQWSARPTPVPTRSPFLIRGPFITAVPLSLEPSGRRIHIVDFPRFRDLPLELKRLIWEECALLPRCIKFGVYGREDRELPEWCQHDWQLFVRGGGEKPAILSVDSESRTIALRHYSASFSGVLIDGPRFFNFAVDSIYFSTSEDLQRAVYPMARNCNCSIQKPTILEFEMYTKLKHLIIGHWKTRKPQEIVTMTLDSFKGLERFTCGKRSWAAMESELRTKTYGMGWDDRTEKPVIEWLAHEGMTRLTELSEEEEGIVQELPMRLESRRVRRERCV